MNVDDLLSCLFEARESLREAEGLANELGVDLAIDEETTRVDQLILHVSASRASSAACSQAMGASTWASPWP